MTQISLADYRQQIEEAIEEERYQEAVAHARHILRTYPKCIDAYWLLGKAMLEAGQHAQAIDMFHRVLSADPEHMLAWVGMSEIARRHDKLEDAVWYLQRAFELATDNDMVARELRHLRGELEGGEPERLQLTESALAKLYLRGDLLTRAITELSKLVEEHPDRSDLRVALAEALWRHGQRLEASRVCQDMVEEQPYVLKPNLILGEIWTSSGRTSEGELHLKRAEALDPENEMAQELFGSASPLPPREPQVEPLEYAERIREEKTDWVAELEASLSSEAGQVLGADMEVPPWLRELPREVTAEAAVEPEDEEPLAQPEAEAELEKPPVAPPAPEEQLPEESVAAVQAAPKRISEQDALSWLERLGTEEGLPSADEEVEEEKIPAWLAELGARSEEATVDSMRVPADLEPEPADIPDWLRDLAPRAAEPAPTAASEAPPTAPEKEKPLEEPSAEDVELEKHEEVAPKGEEREARETGVEIAEETAELPDWLESDEMPSDDDALAWLAQLAEGEGEEAPAEAERERIPATEQEAAVVKAEPSAVEKEEEEEIPAPEEPKPETPSVITAAQETAPPVEETVSVPEEELAPAEEPAEAEGVAGKEEELLVPGDVVREEDLDRFIAAQRAYTEGHPNDHEAQLELGRLLWQADRRRGVVEAYERLINREKLLDDVIADLEDYTEQWSDVSVMQALGDAYVKADRLQDALYTYRQALASL